MSRIEIMSRRRTATHILEGISWENVSGLNERQDAHGNSLAGREIMATGQRFNSRPGGAGQLTNWKGCHGRTSGIQFEARRHTATHFLEGKSWSHVRYPIRGQEAQGNSQSGSDVMAERQESNS